MFERFTDAARRVVVLAQEEARRLGHGHIGTEHILIGVIRQTEGVGASALATLGISLDAVRRGVEELTGRGETPETQPVPFTPRAKRVLEFSLREALQLGHNYIGTEHILLGLIREGEGAAAQVLAGLGADLNRVREQVIVVLGPPARAGAAPRRQREHAAVEDRPTSRIARVGVGFDVHPLVEGRALVVGGVTVPSDRGLDGHSDADVLSHAVVDALLGAAGLGDIGERFPSDDPSLAGASSLRFLEETAGLLARAGWHIVNVDVTVVLEAPSLAPFRDEMRKRVSAALSIEADQVSIKATTTDRLGAIGRGEGAAAVAVALVEPGGGRR